MYSETFEWAEVWYGPGMALISSFHGGLTSLLCPRDEGNLRLDADFRTGVGVLRSIYAVFTSGGGWDLAL